MYTHIKLLGKTCYDHVYVQGEHLISAGWGLLISVAMFAINSCQSLTDNYSFLLGFHTALHVKNRPIGHAVPEVLAPGCGCA